MCVACLFSGELVGLERNRCADVHHQPLVARQTPGTFEPRQRRRFKMLIVNHPLSVLARGLANPGCELVVRQPDDGETATKPSLA